MATKQELREFARNIKGHTIHKIPMGRRAVNFGRDAASFGMHTVRLKMDEQDYRVFKNAVSTRLYQTDIDGDTVVISTTNPRKLMRDVAALFEIDESLLMEQLN